MGHIVRISSTSEIQKLFPLVFHDVSGVEVPFVDSVQCSMLLYPLDGDNLTAMQYGAVQTAARTVFCNQFYRFEVDVPKEMDFLNFNPIDSEESPCFGPRLVNIGCSYGEYRHMPHSGTTVLLADMAQWGALLYWEGWGFIGGTREFMRAFKRVHSNWRSGLEQFEEFWSEHAGGKEVMWAKRILNGLRGC